MAKVLISMKEEFLEEIDALAEEEHRSRSELIREALRLYMRSRQRALLDRRQTASQAQMIESLLLD
ncbi:MAG: ribbon-helix-helix protein, CopG family [Cyanobacteria bacterium HKST-UBA06]|nr:ribbon-helix-helix protein, CopG family [Cyanobacteria bacterium HKST-UBA05]MCA9800158.1 ribbon-helix-helix protein, CopG family [Cyanobacteria bacterium HKST-UBA04]MCA9806718.1 ribbon-helix-helix protein, CopG family [Cyanobacteria bacterium HKST-UBA06]MCA9840512.1 ribbon-helix-helix protein, CopG family [Cyanobacteria bacterium HKST-UBA03]